MWTPNPFGPCFHLQTFNHIIRHRHNYFHSHLPGTIKPCLVCLWPVYYGSPALSHCNRRLIVVKGGKHSETIFGMWNRALFLSSFIHSLVMEMWPTLVCFEGRFVLVCRGWWRLSRNRGEKSQVLLCSLVSKFAFILAMVTY